MKEYAKLLDRDSIIEAINSLNEDDLRFLNQLIVERIKLIAQAKSTRLMADFFIGASVVYHKYLDICLGYFVQIQGVRSEQTNGPVSDE